MTPQELSDWLKAQIESPDFVAKTLEKLPDKEFRLLVYAAAEIFSTAKKEAVRRGIWDEIVKSKGGQ